MFRFGFLILLLPFFFYQMKDAQLTWTFIYFYLFRIEVFWKQTENKKVERPPRLP